MGKSPRKGVSDKIFKKTPTQTTTTEKNRTTPTYAGKNLKSYNHHNYDQKRKYSIADSSSSSDSEKTKYTKIYAIDSGSDSESSLTAVSDEELSRKELEKVYTKGRKTVGKKVKTYAKKRTPKKTVDWSAYQEAIDDSSDNEYDEHDEEEEEEHDDDDEDDEEPHDLEGLYSLMNKRRKSRHQHEDSGESEEESGNSSSEAYSSSDDDSEIDFVKLQHERKAKSMKAVRALKNLPKQKYDESAISDDSDELSDVPLAPKKANNRRKSSIIFRKRADSVLPEDINFTFEFDDAAKDSSENEEQEAQPEPEEEEDIGEEVDYSPTIPEAEDNIDAFDFNFDNQLVPKINEEEINSDEDYEIDDNELLAALQVDNDMDELIEKPTPTMSRQGSIVSVDDEDAFLKEEEKFLVNEFENNGFDEDELNVDGFDSDNSSIRLITSFKGIGNEGDRIKPIIQYETSEDSEEEEDYEDFVDFDVPLFDKSDTEDKPVVSLNKVDKKASKNKKKSNSDEDDDSYLWNYFFSSDNNSSEGEPDETDPVEDLFKEIDNSNIPKKKQPITAPESSFNDSLDMDDDLDYDSGESTDVDLSLPSSNTTVGSKSAKEVLSSKTADYRPPVLGSWITIDSKPFGIIDGLSTRSLTKQEPRTTIPSTKKVIIQPVPQAVSDDSALGLDELLNVSELDDDDENDVKIWRDFNNQKKSVPLGAFRNKSVLQNSLIQPEKVISHKPADFKRRYSNQHQIKKHPHRSSKSKRRRQSIMEAVAEGFRPTKSGLFHENAMVDVEEVLGDDHDLMMLIKGL
ncbi:uncharacterized protein SPAPADRAFT_68242 [Spathaspora passalidarum NRRL Y-27907]|uniref:Protein IFH1 n=1 Tax=Spathaspora passalidarum (strain NRRL Y-27907 / 11-Y1) TaxID=619300 RepID=G3AS69_SPAPN|nr:uncharacterized protein SPAPADRAFT_68242 [Spathaspora passalidarum NRRL Y-27907]EGW31028.1 hypothetical protein SPAPADRAFT_68242 [Spathaspora passalidarum NRRL Y-27907]